MNFQANRSQYPPIVLYNFYMILRLIVHDGNLKASVAVSFFYLNIVLYLRLKNGLLSSEGVSRGKVPTPSNSMLAKLVNFVFCQNKKY